MKAKLLTMICGVLCAVSLCGCAGRMTPLTAQSLTTLAVYEAGKAKPKIVPPMRVAQPVACAVIEKGATLEDIVGAIENSTNLDPETKVAINIILSIFQTATAPQGTNAPNVNPYMKAVFCEGWAGGLALLPADGETRASALRRNAPVKMPKGRWVLVR